MYTAFSPEDSMSVMFFLTAQEDKVHRVITVIL